MMPLLLGVELDTRGCRGVEGLSLNRTKKYRRLAHAHGGHAYPCRYLDVIEQ